MEHTEIKLTLLSQTLAAGGISTKELTELNPHIPAEKLQKSIDTLEKNQYIKVDQSAPNERIQLTESGRVTVESSQTHISLAFLRYAYEQISVTRKQSNTVTPNPK